MLVHAVRLEPNHSEIPACFLERYAAVQADGNGFTRLDPNVREVDLLTDRVVVPFLQLAEIHTRIVLSGPRNTRDHPHKFPVLS